MQRGARASSTRSCWCSPRSASSSPASRSTTRSRSSSRSGSREMALLRAVGATRRQVLSGPAARGGRRRRRRLGGRAGGRRGRRRRLLKAMLEALRHRHPRRRHGVHARTAVVALRRRDGRHRRLGGVPVAAGLADPAAGRHPRRRPPEAPPTARPPPARRRPCSPSVGVGALRRRARRLRHRVGRPGRAARSSSACSCSAR